MRRLGWMGIGAVLVGVSTQCAYPSFVFNGTSSSGEAGAGGTGVGSSSHGSSATSSSGGSPTTSTTTTTASASASSGASTTGTGGSPAKGCHVLKDLQDCGAGERCTIVDESMGTLGCVPLSGDPLGKYEACFEDQDCPAATWCDQRTLVCSPFCVSATGCGTGHCVGASDGTNTIPGVSVCTSHCDPETASPCGTGATCAYSSDVLDFDCFSSGGTPVNGSCTSSGDCAKGLVCGVQGTTGTCLEWCHAAGSFTFGDCSTGYCDEFSPAFSYDGTDYGYCGD